MIKGKENSNRLPFLRRFSGGFSYFYEKLRRIFKLRLSVMLVPHNERRPIQFQINTLLLCFLVAVLITSMASFFFLSSRYAGVSHLVNQREEELDQVEANLDRILDELSEFLQASELFQQTLSAALEQAGVAQGESEERSALEGDLAFVSNLRQAVESEPLEIQSLRNVAGQLRSSVEPLENIESMLSSQKELLTAIPNHWPVANGHGRVTMEFGPNIHPVTGQWYLHKGFDIAGIPGAAILASAEGKVVEARFDPGYGLHVWIRHAYGFRTHYSHMKRLSVSEGQIVQQGQKIGELGNTGISTGPHLDFQVLIGTEVVDPSAFLKISNNFRRWTGNR